MNLSSAVAHKSPLPEMIQSPPTHLWNDSAAIPELTYSIEHGAVGATCNPVIALGVLKMNRHGVGVRIDRP
jgi:transaldolase